MITLAETIESHERYRVYTMMAQHGGSFVRALAEALARADRDNSRRIREAFPEYWQRYLSMHPDTHPCHYCQGPAVVETTGFLRRRPYCLEHVANAMPAQWRVIGEEKWHDEC